MGNREETKRRDATVNRKEEERREVSDEYNGREMMKN